MADNKETKKGKTGTAAASTPAEQRPGTDLKGRINFIFLISAEGANPNGDPLNGNRPRTTIDGNGEISAFCIKRKIRDRIQERGRNILVKSDGRNDDGYFSIQARVNANPALESIRAEAKKLKGKDAEGGNEQVTLTHRLTEKFKAQMCRDYYDVRAFGITHAIQNDVVSFGIRGPVTFRPVFSVAPVDIVDMQIVRSTNAMEVEGKASDTMGRHYYVKHGLYVVEGTVDVQPAELTGFSQADAELLKDAILHLFDNDASAARPDGTMNVVRLYWWQHEAKTPKTGSARIFQSLRIVPKVDNPMSVDDYEITLGQVEGCVEPEVYELG